MKYYVYELWDVIKGEPFYVGKGSGKRATVHMSKTHVESKKNVSLKKNVIRKMLSENNMPIVKYVYVTDDEIAAYNEETRLILKYGQRDIDTGILTNLTNGGVGSTCPNKLTREKLSKAQLGKKDSEETRLKKVNASKNRIITDETRQKMSIVKLGKVPACVELRRSYKGEGNPQFGKTWPEEKRNKMSNSIKGRKRSYRADGTWFFTYPEKV